MVQMSRFIIGVDEAGRGPLAGPVAVGVVMIRQGMPIRRYFKGINDSKKLSPELREALYEQLRVFQNNGIVRYTVVFSSASVIDRFGISAAVQRAVYKGVRTLSSLLESDASTIEILLDGLLHAPPQFQQQTIIKGDELVPVISLASIAAKVERDRLMRRLAKKYPKYGFEHHKGYGTREHYAAIQKHGLCDIHRKSWRITSVDGMAYTEV
jgi:ribonuclease HII